MMQMLYLMIDTWKGHLRSNEVIQRFLPITFNQIEIQTWKLYQHVCGVVTHRMIYSMTYLGESWLCLTLTSGQISNWPFGVITYMVWCVSTREARWCLYLSSTSTRKKLFAENFYRKNGHFTFGDLWRLNSWHSLMFDSMALLKALKASPKLCSDLF